MKKLAPIFKGCSPNSVTQGFSQQHQAVDFSSTYGTFLTAPFDATIVRIVKAEHLDEKTGELASGCGLLMTATEDPTYRVSFWHCLPVFPVEAGDVVKQGTPVAQMGNTGFVQGVINGEPYTYTVEEREGEIASSTPSNLPKKGVHVHVSMGLGDGTAEGTKNVPITDYIDWNIPVDYDLITTIKVVYQKIINLINGK